MKIKEMIEKLKEYDPELEVTITDGFECRSFRGDFEFSLYKIDENIKELDIGIGGLEWEEDNSYEEEVYET